jgi:hypothetical protein
MYYNIILYIYYNPCAACAYDVVLFSYMCFATKILL